MFRNPPLYQLGLHPERLRNRESQDRCMYSSASSMENGIKSVKQNAPTATTKELTA